MSIKKVGLSLILGSAVLGLFWMFTSAVAKEKGTTLKVATYNLRAPEKNDTNAQRSVLQKADIEIAGLQEVNYKSHRFSGSETYNTLTNFKNDYFKNVYFGNAMDLAGGGYGIGVVSKYAFIEKSNTHIYSSETGEGSSALIEANKNYNPDDQATIAAKEKVKKEYPASELIEPRTYTRTVIKKDGKEIAFYNTHLSFENTPLRQKQFSILADVMKKDSVKYQVLVGDFNADQNTTDWKIFTKHFNIANGKDGVWRDSYIGEDDTMKVNSIDNIITSKNIEIKTVSTLKSDESDHVPLIAELVLK